MIIRIASCLKTIKKSSSSVFEFILGGWKLPLAVFLRAVKAYFKTRPAINICMSRLRREGKINRTERKLRTTINMSGRG